MQINGNTILITGGATGIGFALASTLVNAGNKVIICGRRENKLKEAMHKLPQILTKVSDVSKEKEREELFVWAKDNYPDLNVLINNAGIQKNGNLKKGTKELFKGENEIETNFVAPILPVGLFYPLVFEEKRRRQSLMSPPAWVLCRSPRCRFIVPPSRQFIHLPYLSGIN